MKIGPYTLYQIETGRFALDGGAMFGVVPQPLWKKTNPPDERNRITLASRALLAVGGGRIILIDNGNGPKFTDKLRDIYRLDESGSDLRRSLAAAGVSPGDVTDVILTHLHFDHAGGSTVRDGNDLVPAFPRARYYLQRAHWEQALHPTEKDRASFFPDDYQPLIREHVLEFLDGPCTLFPHIDLLVMNGHTAAQQLPKISDGSTTLLFGCDLLPTSSHIPIPYIMAYDLRPLVTLEEKKVILNTAAEEGWIIYFEHDPATAVGKITRTEKGFALDPAPVVW
jgi:glyoxylase-like metal-dependent hydrolase (beta-lactamase superfamily II)